MTADFAQLLEGITLVALCVAGPWFFGQVTHGGRIPHRLAALALWGVGGEVLGLWWLSSDATRETFACLWLAWMLPCMLFLWTNWMREWPLGLLDANATLEELKAALSVAETIRLGGRAGARVFFVLAWLSLLVGFFDALNYGCSALRALEHDPVMPPAWLHAEVGMTGVLAAAWLLYTLWLWYRAMSYFGPYAPECRRTSLLGRNDYPTSEFLLCSPEEASAFLRLFSDACPLPNLGRSAYLSRGKLTLTALLYLFHWCEKVLGFNAGVLPFLNAASGIVLLIVLGTILPWLFRETRQWQHPDRICPCAYAPLLRLARYAGKLRDRPCRSGAR